MQWQEATGRFLPADLNQAKFTFGAEEFGSLGGFWDVDRTSLSLQGVPLFDRGSIVPFDEPSLHGKLGAEEVRIELDLGLGDGAATAWGCDLTTEYVHINADYRT